MTEVRSSRRYFAKRNKFLPVELACRLLNGGAIIPRRSKGKPFFFGQGPMQSKRIHRVGFSSIIVGAVGAAGGVCSAQNALEASSNWSGYFASASSGNAFSDISSSWVVPTVQASSSGTTYSADWIGFDGANDTTVEQCGTSGDISSTGSASYYAWYEFYPAGEVEIPSLAVHPGDDMSADITYEASESTTSHYAYSFDLSDQTTGISFAKTLFTSSNDNRSSAEWIAEAPSVGGQQTTLANFGSVTFSDDLTALNGGSDAALGTLNPTGIEMVQNGSVVATPTSLSAGGETFSVNYGSGPPSLTWNNAGGASPSDGKTWDIGNNNNWNNGTKATVYTDGAIVTFNDSNNGHYAVTLNTMVSPGSVTFNSSGNYTISGSGGIAGSGSLTKLGTSTLTLSTINTFTGGTIVNAGSLVVGTTGALPDSSVSITGGTLQLGTGTGVAQMTSLSISGSGKLDVNNNHFLINYGSGADPISTIGGYLKTGYNGGVWNGSGIDSSAAAANPAYALGYADGADGVVAGLSSGTIEVKYTLLGDANLDGTVDGNDFTILIANLGKVGSSWDQGDFDYDGAVSGSDFTDLIRNLGDSTSGADVVIPAADYAAIDAFAAANGLMVDVPEPACDTLAVVVGVGFLCRRSRRMKTRATKFAG
jgi:autotransporter-associated beta strand protein